MICLRSIDGNSVDVSWDPTAVSGQITKSNKIFFFFGTVFEYIYFTFIIPTLNAPPLMHKVTLLD